MEQSLEQGRNVLVLGGEFGKVSLLGVQLERHRLVFPDMKCGFLNGSGLPRLMSPHLLGLLHLHKFGPDDHCRSLPTEMFCSVPYQRSTEDPVLS